MIETTPFLLLGVLIVAVVLIIYISLAKRENPYMNRQRYQTHWLEIENSLNRDNAATYHMAILNADKLLDQALKDRRFRGQTMGERMKAANKEWKNADHVWTAHKIRNQLAHETNAKVNYDTAIRALSAYKQALKDLGAI